jgi:predicted nuclease of predicted toxin-antitoxin system
MRIYVDEDTVATLLIKLLRKAGHDVVEPADVNLVGKPDPTQLLHAIFDDRVCLTKNCDDFFLLHTLVVRSGGGHPGVLVVRQVNDPTRDLSAKGIVTAIRKLESANVPIANECIELNHWR